MRKTGELKHRPAIDGKNRRGSREAVEKRRAARLFNEALLGRPERTEDGRTQRKRKRLLLELSTGKTSAGRPLKPIDVLLRVQTLLELGEPLEAIKKSISPVAPISVTREILESLKRLDAAYGFPLEAYAFLGLGLRELRKAGLGKPGVNRPGIRRASVPSARRGAA